MKSLLLACALLLAAPVSVAAAEEAPSCITFDSLGLPASAEKIALTADERATVREISVQSGHEVSTDVVEMIAVPGPLTETVLIVGLNEAHCVDGAAVVSARTWVLIHGQES